MKKYLLLSLSVLILAGCGAPRYTGSAIPEPTTEVDVVIVKDAETREGFLNTMETWLQDNDYTYTVVPDKSQHDLDKLTLEYEGHWGWDLALFLKQAEINAYQNGQRVGEVEFKVPYTANPNKFGNATKRIGFMMDTVFGKKTAEEATKAANSSNSKATN
ncbi:Sbal_3080 family lipoprotein [Vibrio bathopelagicus]|uniref:Sbal_3080 family lipoprotein n=1 Tax=Vibrio bathopelagicus TaxID=2777577 RepID=UPI0018644DA0|nr:Sbal_3080 family lipoprotein [Vibrio bathopelagicus]